MDGNSSSPSGSSLAWAYHGDGAAFVVGAEARLEMRSVVVSATSGLAFQISTGANVITHAVQLRTANGRSSVVALLGVVLTELLEDTTWTARNVYVMGATGGRN